MKFYLFSYNRGEFLRNCIDSIEYCCPDAEIIVYDDDSDDEHTRLVLRQIRTRHAVISSNKRSGHKHGGLYNNMQAAFLTVPDNEIFCFLQDDVQLVRPFSAEDIQFVESAFRQEKTLGFVSPTFIRSFSLRGRQQEEYRYDTDQRLFFWDNNTRSAGSYYSDIFLAHSTRLREKDWSFLSGEPANQAQARDKFQRMGYMACPFMMWLPYGRAYRGKKRTLALRIAEQRKQCGFYPFHYLTDDELKQMHVACPPNLPIAERYLNNVNPELEQPWIYNPLQGSRWLKQLNKLETLLHRA